MVVEVAEVSKVFKSQKILKDVSLKIEDSEIFGLIGPSGAGKTTLIRIMIGALAADTGTVRIGDIRMPSLQALNKIGYMPQNDALYPDLSGADNLRFFAGMYGLSGRELNFRIDEALHLVQLQDDRNKKVSHYSGGMKKRLSLAASLLHHPELLFLDEPTVGIDPVVRKKIWDEFYGLKKRGVTIIVTTHVMDEAVKCDRLGLIYNGGIIACDTVDILLNRTAGHTIEELFLLRGDE